MNAALLSLMAEVTYTLGRAALVDIFTILIAGLRAIAILQLKVGAIWLLLIGGCVSLILY